MLETIQICHIFYRHKINIWIHIKVRSLNVQLNILFLIKKMKLHKIKNLHNLELLIIKLVAINDSAQH